ncbi:hypothetical protein [Streptomyces nigrescens]
MGSLSIPPLAELRKRRSAKWRTFPDDVLPLPVAEMDFPLAEPVAKVLHEAVDRSDTGSHLLAAARVALNAGHRYGPSGHGFARLNFGCAPQTLTEALTRIAAVC